MRFSVVLLLLLLTGAAQAQTRFRYYLHPDAGFRLRVPLTWAVTRNVQGVDRLRAPDGSEIHIPRGLELNEESGFTKVVLGHGYCLHVRYGADRTQSERVLQSLEFTQPVCGLNPTHSR